MAAPPAKLIADAAAVAKPANASVLVLNDELVCTYDQQGRLRERHRSVYEILDENGRQAWSHIGVSWSPWHQTKPQIRARVVTAARQAFTLDAGTIETSAVHEHGDVYSDRQVMRAPLPGVAVGAVIEVETVTQDAAPFFPAGTAERFFFGGTAPTHHTRLRIEAPATLPLSYAAGPIPGLKKADTTVAGGRVIELEAGPLDALPEPWPGQSPESYLVNQVGFATGSSWAAVARAYAELLDRQIGKPDLKDFVDQAAHGLDPRRDRDKLIARLVFHLGAEIKYSGVEFGDASILPRTPAEIFARRYGDCKDKALLLAALLRSVGISAQVALLDAGFRPDVDPRLPGLGAFNHAIVFVPGAKPLWIDPTDRFSTLGELPKDDQGRLALIISPTTTALTRTPEAAAAANMITDQRQVTVGENGDVHVVERSDMTGGVGRNMRAGYAHADRKMITRQLETHVRGTYEASTLGPWSYSDVYAVDRPFHVDLETTDAKNATVTDDAAAVMLPLAGLIEFLPEPLRTSDTSLTRLGPDGTRSVDYILPEPFVYELRYRVTPPHGFTLDSPPGDETMSLGPARFSARYRAEKTGELSAEFTFDTGKGRFTPAELEAFTAAMKKLLESPTPTVTFHQLAAAAAKAGNVRLALAEARRLDHDHPGTALHASQLAELYLQAGLGSAARAEAGRAAALDPRSARAQRAVGWVLEHDLLGRRFGEGSDVAGAERAYRHALELDSGDNVSRASLIILLEHGSGGAATLRPGQIEEVLALHRKFRETSKNPDALLVNYLNDMFNAERFADVLGEKATITGPLGARALRVAARAALSGPAAALQEAPRLVSDTAQLPQALTAATFALLRVRRYPAAAALLAQTATEGNQHTRALIDALRITRRREELRLDDRNPGDAAKLFLAAGMDLLNDVPGAFDRVRALAAPSVAAEFDRDGAAGTRAQVQTGYGAPLIKNGGLPLGALGDMVASTNVTVGGHAGEVCRVSFPLFAPQTDKPDTTLIFAPDRKGHYKFVAAGSNLSSLGSEALRLLDGGDLTAARKLLDAATIGFSMGVADEPLSAPPFTRLWLKGGLGDARQARIAAAALLVADEARAAEGIAPLSDCLAHPASQVEALGCRVAVVLAFGQVKKPDDAATAAGPLEWQFPDSKLAFNLHVSLLNAAHRSREAMASIQARLARNRDDVDARRRLSAVQLGLGDLRGAEATAQALTAENGASDQDFNTAAWLRLLRGRADDETLSLARRAVEAGQRRRPEALHTLASVLAEADRPEEAYRTLLEEIEVRATPSHPGMVDAEWYVIGRIAESYGAIDAAREAYGHCQKPADLSPDNTWYLVQRRLKALPRAPKPSTSGSAAAVSAPPPISGVTGRAAGGARAR